MCGTVLRHGPSPRWQAGGGSASSPDAKKTPLEVELAPSDRNLIAIPVPGNFHDGSPGVKMIVIIVVLLLVLAAIGFIFLTSPFPLSPFPSHNTPTGGFMWVDNDDNRTVRATFGEFDPETSFDDVQYQLRFDNWTSPRDQPIIYPSTDFYSFGYYALITFVDNDRDGTIDIGDYCVVYSSNAPWWMTCELEIFFDPTDELVCHTYLTFY